MKESAERLSSSIVPPGKRFFLVVGGGYPNKNHVRAVSAFGKAFQAFDNMHLLVIERNRTSPPELRRAVRRTQLPERIIIRDSVAAEELVALYNRAEALVFPSLYEGFGLPILEAMACGCPVLCSDTTAPPEVAGDAALLLPPNDDAAIAAAMRRIVEDRALQQSLSERGIRRAALFDWQKMAAETVRLYAEIAPWIPAPTLTANLSTR
jgi:glycosyltransferase involved in cell wall biosynthesis